MAIFKAKVKNNFTTLVNNTVQDKNLTFEATGLLAFLLSLPDDWEIVKEWLMDQKQKCGRDKLTRMIKELETQGYVVKKIKQDEQGKLKGYDWFVYPEPQITRAEPGVLKNRRPDNPATGKPATTKETDLQKKQLDKKILHRSCKTDVEPSKKKTIQYSNEFLEIWKARPQRQGSNPKRDAFFSYRARIQDGYKHEDLLNAIKKYFNYCKAENILNTRYVMQMSRFFGTNEEFKNNWKISHDSQNAAGSASDTRTSMQIIKDAREQYLRDNPGVTFSDSDYSELLND